MDDDGPVLGADPDKPPSEGALRSQTPAGWFSSYFEEAWNEVEPARREAELNWPLKPWSVGKKTAFLGWAKNVLMKGLDGNTALAGAFVDEFCQHHDRYFSPYANSSVWKQFNRHLDRIRANVLAQNPGYLPQQGASQSAPSEATLERHRERQARDEERRQGGPDGPSQFLG